MGKLLVFLVSFFISTCSFAQILYNETTLAVRKAEVLEGKHKSAYKYLIECADKAMTHTPRSVMDKKHVAVSGDKHDYCSLSYYAWPDETKPGGLPYIVKDGQPNPEYKEYDYENLVSLKDDINTLALAWYFSGNDKYAEKAVQMIRTWFLNKATAMNPNLWYCQVNPGKKDGMGYNVLDGSCVADLLNGVMILEHSGFLKKSEKKKLRKWIRQFNENIQATEWGCKNENYVNNHTIAYDKQIVSYLIFTGEKKKARVYLKNFPERRLFKQLAPDGSFPEETKRPRGYDYSWYNMRFLVDMHIIAKNAGIRLDEIKNAEGQNLFSAIDYLAQFVGKPKSAWTYQEIGDWEQTQRIARRELYRIAHTLDSRYIILLKLCGDIPQEDLYRLIY